MTISERLNDHYLESLNYFSGNQIVGIFLQGSQNYGLDLPTSDVDTKLITVPSFRDIVINQKPVSTTHVRYNDEHTDWKDIRLYMETFRKQNLNFLEILFTDYYYVNPLYEEQWIRLVKHREEIARMNPARAVASMAGIAREKYHAMEHLYPSKITLIEKYGYDGKQVHHLLRVEDYLRRYIAGESYERCLKPTPSLVPLLMDLKEQKIPLETGRNLAEESLANVEKMYKDYKAVNEEFEDPTMRELLTDVQCNIMEIALKKELGV